MKKLLLSMVITPLMIIQILAAEFREFTNQEGKVIVARVVNCDAEGDRVQLELKNRKKAWVMLSSLSKEDQTYIRNVNLQTNKAPHSDQKEPLSKPLSKAALKDIGEEYIAYVEGRPGSSMKSIFLNMDVEWFQYYGGDLKRATEKIWVKSIDPGDGLIVIATRPKQIPDKNPRNKKGYKYIDFSGSRGIDQYSINYRSIQLMVTPEGKIKYDSLQCRHPLQRAALYVRLLESYYGYYAVRRDEGPDAPLRNPSGRPVRSSLFTQERKEDVETAYHQLKGLGVPLYGFDLSSSSERDFEKSMRQIKKWLIKNGEEWDVSEPKVYIPSSLYQWIKKGLS